MCNVTDIDGKFEDSQRVIEKLMACKRKTDLKLKQKSIGSEENHSESYSNTGQVTARTSQAKAKLPKSLRQNTAGYHRAFGRID